MSIQTPLYAGWEVRVLLVQSAASVTQKLQKMNGLKDLGIFFSDKMTDI